MPSNTPTPLADNIADVLFQNATLNLCRTFYGHTALDTDDGEQLRADTIFFLRAVNAALVERALTKTHIRRMQDRITDYTTSHVKRDVIHRFVDAKYPNQADGLECYIRERLFLLFTRSGDAVCELLVDALTRALRRSD